MTETQQYQQPRPTVPCKYRAGRELGRGTYAVVKEMQHIASGQRYAGKIINKQKMVGHETSISNELGILRRLHPTPHVLTLADYFETPSSVYLITELCTGELFDLLRQPLSPVECNRLVRQLVQGVVALHQAGVVHRDLKPENCLLNSSGDLVIGDFGMARVLDQADRPLTSLCGTPGYMAPEMLLRTGHGTPADMWAVGVIACFMLTGSNPFHGAGQKLALTEASLGSMLRHLRSRRPDINAYAWSFVEGLLQYDPARRMTAEQALAHPWLSPYPSPGLSPYASPYMSPYLTPYTQDSRIVTASSAEQTDAEAQQVLALNHLLSAYFAAGPSTWQPLTPPSTPGGSSLQHSRETTLHQRM